jgi:hypothetical protein
MPLFNINYRENLPVRYIIISDEKQRTLVSPFLSSFADIHNNLDELGMQQQRAGTHVSVGTMIGIHTW